MKVQQRKGDCRNHHNVCIMNPEMFCPSDMSPSVVQRKVNSRIAVGNPKTMQGIYAFEVMQARELPEEPTENLWKRVLVSISAVAWLADMRAVVQGYLKQRVGRQGFIIGDNLCSAANGDSS